MENLQIGGVSCRSLADEFGTPLYVYDESKIISQAKAAVTNFASEKFDTQVVYASKAFSSKTLFRLLADEGLGFDVVSGGELYCAIKTGVDMSEVYFHGNNKSDEEIAATVKFIKYLTSVDSINEMCKSSPTTYAEKVTIDTGNYLLDDVNAIMAENTESKLEIPTYDSNTAAMDTIRNSLQALATGASAQEVGDDIVDKMSAYE